MRAGVLQLLRFGVLPGIARTRHAAIRSASFIYGDDEMKVPVKPRDGVDALYAPRRTVLDRAIVDVAAGAGVDFCYGTTIVDVVRAPDGRVSGVVVKRDSGIARSIRAGLVIGADGVRSAVARLVQAPVTRKRRCSDCHHVRYWADVPVEGYRWYSRPGLSAGAIPTNNGLTCVFASVPARRFAEVFKDNPERGYRQALAEVAPDLDAGTARRRIGWESARMARAAWLFCGAPPARGGRLSVMPRTSRILSPRTGSPMRSLKPSISAHAVVRGTDEALRDYERDRDRRVATIFEVTDRIASFDWSLEELGRLHKQLARAMSDEVTTLNTRTGEGLLVLTS